METLDNVPTLRELHVRPAQLFLNPLQDHQIEMSRTLASLSPELRLGLVEKAYKVVQRQLAHAAVLQRRAAEHERARASNSGLHVRHDGSSVHGGSANAAFAFASNAFAAAAARNPFSMRTSSQTSVHLDLPPEGDSDGEGGGEGGWRRGVLSRLSRCLPTVPAWLLPSPRLAYQVHVLRSRLWLLFEYPESSGAAWVLSTVFIGSIALASATFCLDTVSSLDTPRAQYIFDTVEVTCITIFTVDVGVRTLTTPTLGRFLRSAMTWIDYGAIVPYFVGLGLSQAGGDGGNANQSRIVRLVRLVRVVRVLKLFKRFARIQVVVTALTNSRDMLGLLLMLVLMFLTIFSTMIYYCERGKYLPELGYWSRDMPFDTSCSAGALAAATPQTPFDVALHCSAAETPFNSIPASMWWCVVTLLTIGYGDVVPFSPLGKLVASFCMVFGLLLLSLPISVIGTQFTQEWITHKATQKQALELRRRAPSFNSLRIKLIAHNELVDGVLVRTRDVLFDIEDLRSRMMDKCKSEGREGASTTLSELKRETEIISLELQLREKLLQLEELLSQSELLRNLSFVATLEGCRASYRAMQLKAGTISAMVSASDEVEEALDRALLADLAREAEAQGVLSGGGDEEGGMGHRWQMRAGTRRSDRSLGKSGSRKFTS